jgi:hypothetical protein
MTLERQTRAITETEIDDIYPGNSTASTADTTPQTDGLPEDFVDGKVIKSIDSKFRPESILFIQTEFDLERLERQLSDWSQKNLSLTTSSGNVCQDVTIGSLVSINQGEIFQERDSKDPPLTYSFNRSKFYVRACYKVYYDLIIACLKTGEIDFLTLIGTPGTGKSMLYLYVVHHFRRDNPMVTIVVAAFDEASNLLECWEYKPGEDPKRCSKIPQIRDSVHFYDGTPSMLPRYQKMVCFTCLNYKWIDLHIKEPRHECLWFPPWTLDELLDADEVCELGLGEETITTRFNFFGGSARYCLSSDDEYVERGRQLVLRKTAAIYSKAQLEVCLLGGVNDTLSHDVFHLLPEIFNIFRLLA